MKSFLVFLAIIAAIVVWAISIYNRLVNERNRVRNAFAQIDVQLTRRYDLIPNLVEAVKGYMKHERETLEAVINARNAAQQSLQVAKADPANAEAIKQLGASEGALGAVLGRLFALSEAYPDLKANENMMQYGEQSGVRAPGVQRFGAQLQQYGRELPEQCHRRDVPLRARELPRDRV